MESQESSCFGSASMWGSTLDCARSDDGNKLKLTIREPLVLRNCRRESFRAFMVITPYTNCPDARLTARRILTCVPQRHRLPANASLICVSVGLGFLSSKALVVMIMPLMQ